MNSVTCLALLALISVGIGVGEMTHAQESVEPLSTWTGSSDNESLANITPLAITHPESWSILWKAWQVDGELPQINFDDALVVVSTTRGSKLNVKYQRTAEGDLKVAAMATRDLRPGFRYQISVIPRAGLTSVAGQPLANAEPGNADGMLPEVRSHGVPYFPRHQLSGDIRLVGSRTLEHLVSLWASGFRAFHPEVKSESNHLGSNSSLKEFRDHDSVIAALSRLLTDQERAKWQEQLNRDLEIFPVCMDQIEVVVHPDNPIKTLNLQQLKMIFAPAAGAESVTWGDLGLEGPWANKPVVLHGRDAASGTRQYLHDLVGHQGDTDANTHEHESYSQIIGAVAADPTAIGYSRACLVRDTVKPVVFKLDGQPPIQTLSRTCYLAVTVEHGKPMPPVMREFLTFVYRLEGQSQLFKDGFSELPKAILREQLERLGVIDGA